ncbi:MAG TPA: SIS domain-containing protein [Clostridiales bacterium]|jgi:glucosamine--fructose-6-phosphate aminotransferase (isomerizing)|nr:SIS domain-containing protein [Clostridiales bacterium]
MSLMLEELLSAHKSLGKIIETNLETIDKISQETKNKNIAFITTVARGTSNHAAAFFKYICELKSGIMVSRFNHSVTTIAGKNVDMSKSLVIGISQSGTSHDTLKVMQTAKECGAITVAVTNYPSSPLAKLCDHHIYLNCGEEKSVAATKTFTLQIANLHLLACRLGGEEAPDFDKIANDICAYIKNIAHIEALAQKTKNMNNMIVLSRGITLPFADELSLKLLETCYKFSRSYSVAEFAHGPYALVEKGRTVLLLAPSGDYAQDFIKIAHRLKSDNAELIAFTDIKEIMALSDYYLEMPSVDKNSEIYLYITALQSYAAFTAQSLSLNPDKPRGLNKITNTL